jgi:hypothetical protein
MNVEQKADFFKQAMIPQDVSLKLEYFEKFYEGRKAMLTDRICKLLG